MDAIRWQETSLALLDQTKLPTQEVWEDYTDYREVAEAIRRLVVRGAPAIGAAGGGGRGAVGAGARGVARFRRRGRFLLPLRA